MTPDQRRDAITTVTVGISIVLLVVFVVVMFQMEMQRPAPAPPPPRTAEEIHAERLAEHPETFLALESLTGQISGFGTVLILSGRIRNTSERSMRDPLVVCEMLGPSGSVTSEVSRVLYQRIEAHGTTRFRRVNMGLMDSQSTQYRCTIRSAQLGG